MTSQQLFSGPKCVSSKPFFCRMNTSVQKYNTKMNLKYTNLRFLEHLFNWLYELPANNSQLI